LRGATRGVGAGAGGERAARRFICRAESKRLPPGQLIHDYHVRDHYAPDSVLDAHIR